MFLVRLRHLLDHLWTESGVQFVHPAFPREAADPYTVVYCWQCGTVKGVR